MSAVENATAFESVLSSVALALPMAIFDLPARLCAQAWMLSMGSALRALRALLQVLPAWGRACGSV